MVQIKIIRHSERLDYSRPLSWALYFGHYWADAPLTKNGHAIAKKKAVDIKSNDFHPKYIYTSPYIRTMATATEMRSVFSETQIIIEPLLAEFQPNFQHHISLYPDGIPTTYLDTETDFCYPETYQHFEKRVKFIISKLIEKHNEDIIIITHGEILKSYIGYIQSMYPELMIDPGSTPYLTTLSFNFDKANGVFIEDSIRIE